MRVTFLAALGCLAAADPAPPTWDDLGNAAGLAGAENAVMVPVWIDVDEDGEPDPLWLSPAKGHTLSLDEDGAPTLVPVALPATLLASQATGIRAAVLDVDGDGTDEILVAGGALHVLHVTAPHVLEEADGPLPRLPGATVFDMAVGDLNADGLPDAVLALGLYVTDRISRRGHPDLVLMNLGEGRFELQPLTPTRVLFTRGITLADVNGDRRPDLIESVDFSHFTSRSRVLLNQTPPAARTPVFQVTPTSYDTGLFGMGVAAEDVDGDGHVDLYATSVGLDLFARGNEDGGWDDQTVERGFRHEWGQVQGGRSQWSPTWVDLNGDGLLDLVVRHGAFGVESALLVGPPVTVVAPDLVYVQGEDGDFHRTTTPFDKEGPSRGRQAVVGDVDGDGRPDVALGGEGGSAGFWRNVTVAGPTSRQVTVRLRPTVSASPSVGATVTGTCGSSSLSRMVTSGGHMGGSAAHEVHLAWPDCTYPVEIAVSWPSGAETTHALSDSATTLVAEEPRWWYVPEDSPGQVIVDPGQGGGTQACVIISPGTLECCAVADAPCTIVLPPDPADPMVIKLQNATPMALPQQPSSWSVLTEPSPPRPGDTVKVHVMHVGDPASFAGEEVSVFLGGTFVSWSKVDSERRIRTAVASLAPGAPELAITLFPLDVFPNPTWTLPTGRAVDPRWAQVDVYPVRVSDGVTALWQWAAFVTGRRGVAPVAFAEQVALETLAGDGIPTTDTAVAVSTSRLRLLADWDALGGQSSVTLYDGDAGFRVDLPVGPTRTLEEATDSLAVAVGSPAKNRLVEDGDLTAVFFVLQDDEGQVLPPEPELATLETDGAAVVTQPDLVTGPYTLFGLVRTDPGTDPGEIRVLAADGRELAAFPFSRRPVGPTMAHLGLSWATWTDVIPGSDPAITHAVLVHAVNRFDEVLGANVSVTVDLDGGALALPIEMRPAGDHLVSIAGDPGIHPLVVDVVLDGEWLTTLTLDVDLPDLPVDQGVETQIDNAQDVLGSDGATVEYGENDGADGGGGGGGCDCRAAPGTVDPWPWLALMILAWRRRRPAEDTP